MSQLMAIKESFERSEISRYHKRNIPCFSLLRGAVSNEALDLMVKEIDRSNGFQLDSSTCACQQHKSCGLPCACRLSLYVHLGECIPLDSIDKFWRTLNLSPATSLQSDNIRCDTEIHKFKEHFNKQTEAGKRSFLRKLVDIFNPSKTTMKRLAVKKNTLGRPSLKKQKKYAPPKSKDLRTCSQSARFFGIDLNTEPERHSSYTNYQTNCDRDPIPDLNEEPARHSSFVDLNEEPTNFFDYIPENFHPHIIDFYDVRGDGNCGFRKFGVCGCEFVMESVLIDRVQNSLRDLIYTDAIFKCELLCAEFPSETNLQLLARCYLQSNKSYAAYQILKGTQKPQSRYLFAISCFQMDLLKEAEMALCPSNEPSAEVPNGAAGHYLLGLIY
ncbi:FAR1-related sequence 5-like protein, partial [Tanacetum coccineum]